ncbi:MAG: DUF222 domain-containing protein [Nocardioidaceae bacterium]
MSALLDLHPDADGVVTVLAEVHAALDGLGPDLTLASGDYAVVVGEVERAISRLSGVKLRLVAAADKARVASAAGLSGTSAWLSVHTRATGASAAGQVALAGALASLPATDAALAEGSLSAEHAGVIAAATAQLPAGLDPDQRAKVEQRLVTQAETLDVAALRKKARRALEAVASQVETDRHHDQVLHDEETLQRARTRLTLHDNPDGTLTGHFTIPALAGAILKKTIQQLASPRRGRLGAGDAHTGPVGDRLDWAHRHGQALVELLEHLPTDRLHHKSAATIVVTLDQHQLTDDLAAAGLDTGHEISASEARRLACSAGILPAALAGGSLPLDLGRTRRFFTEAQRIALGLRYTSCAADGCDRPYAWTELHHRDPWHLGGRTDLKDAIPLCGFHHHRIHDPAYHHREHPDSSVTFHLRR